MVAIPAYRPVVKKTKGHYSATALVGSHSASIAWDVDPNHRAGLLGFAVKKTEFDLTSGNVVAVNMLKGEKRFKGDVPTSFEVSSAQAPFQRFRWSDYTLRPDQGYRFEIFPVRGAPGALTLNEPPIVLDIRPSPDVVNGFGVYVNRGVTSAFAYLDRFKGQNPKDVPDGAAYRWLSRGLKEGLLTFISSAKNGEALHVCIYEFFDDEVAAALAAARSGGVDVRIVYHAKADDKATSESAQVLKAHGLEAVATPRVEVGNISHNKFIVHHVGGQPRRLFTGTANFSENAFYFQTNAAVTVDDPATAADYDAYFNILKSDPPRIQGARDSSDARVRVKALMDQVNGRANKRFSHQFFSPIAGLDILDAAESLIDQAKSCVFVSAPFGFEKGLIDKILSRPELLHYGLANTTAKKKVAALATHNTRYFTPSVLETYLGRNWDSKAFGNHKIHTKVLLIDPWSSNPQALFGSANFSDESCQKNDENAFLTRDPRVCAILTTEFMRMYDHYKSRGFINQLRTTGHTDDDFLKPDDSWLRTSFDPVASSHKFLDRQTFVGR